MDSNELKTKKNKKIKNKNMVKMVKVKVSLI